MERILIKGNNWLGDAVMSLPTLQSLRAMRPHAHVSLLTRSSLADLYDGHPSLDEVIPYPSDQHRLKALAQLARDLHRRNFDTALVLPRSFSSALLMFSSRIPRRIGYRGDGRTRLLTDALPREERLLKKHRVHYFHHLLTAIGQPPPPQHPHITVSDRWQTWALETIPGNGLLIGMNPGATYGEAKQWYPDRFSAVGRHLAVEFNARILILGGPSEAELGRQVADKMGRSATNFAGRTSIPQLAALIQRCSLFITNDTGPMHLADALGIPIVAIFGSTDPVTTAPFRRRHSVVRHLLDCMPCQKRRCPLGHHHCMKWVRVEDVIREAIRWLKRP